MSDDFVSPSERKSNIKRVFSDPRKRLLLIIVVSVAALMLVFPFFTGGKQDDSANATGTKGVSTPNIKATPGLVTDSNYKNAVDREDQRRLEAAGDDSTKSVVIAPTQKEDAPPLDPFAGVEQEAPQTQAPIVDPFQAAAAASNPTQPQPQVAPQSVGSTVPVQAAPDWNDQAIRSSKRYENMKKQLDRYSGNWVATASQEFVYNGKGQPEVQSVDANANVTNSVASTSPSVNNSGTSSSSAAIIRAGTIVPAEMLTPLNSDAPGPVLARIVSGPFAGARVLGSFNATNKEITVQFRTLSVPGHKSSYSINAYAVNPELGVGVATDVNNHYFKRYGLSLAAGFLSEYGSAWGSAGQQTTIVDGAVVITNDDLDSSRINKIALGGLGKELSSQLKRDSNVAPTVKAEGKNNEGLPIGLLFMSDF